MPEAERPADGLSIVSLASGIASVVLLLFSIIPLIGMCLGPLSAICASLATLTGIASLIRTAIKPELEGRYQALSGILFALLWGGGAAIMFNILIRH